MAARDELPCGCRWVRDPSFGDVLERCEGHVAGTAGPYPGSEPSAGDAERIVDLLDEQGHRVVALLGRVLH